MAIAQTRAPELLLAVRLVACVALAGALGAGCGGGNGDSMDAGGQGGADARVGEGGTDGGRSDGGTDGGPDLCAAVTCEPFEHCVAGVCMPYPPCAGDGSCPAGSTCHARSCVPDDVDIDGDGSPAGEDCDETDPQRSPLEDEICDGDDDDCDDVVDEGDPAEICEYYPGGGVCIEGSCGCPAGTFDLDRTVAGCECTAVPAPGEGVTCETAIDLGDFPDAPGGTTHMVSGNVLPDDREVWYRFRAVDLLDTSCDNFHVRVRLAENPGDVFEMGVSRGSCGAAAECPSPETPLNDYEWATDLRADIGGRLTGECPCTAAGVAPVADQSTCTDNTTVFYVSVRRRPGSALSCDSYAIEISNGVYDTM